MRRAWLVVSFFPFGSLSCFECFPIHDQILVNKLLRATMPIVELRTEKKLNIRANSLRLSKCGNRFHLSFEAGSNSGGFWSIDMTEDFTNFTVSPPE